MKTIRLNSIFLIILASFIYLYATPSKLQAQNAASNNLEKYWKYRERLKNFVVVGDCQGCSLPANSRNNVYNSTGSLGWSDATITDGFYIGTLATEYKLLSQIASPTPADIAQKNRTIDEMGYALQALNGLDMTAEWAWQQSSPCYVDQCSPTYWPTQNLNGFLIRDDIPQGNGFFTFVGSEPPVRVVCNTCHASWLETQYNGKYIVDYLNSGLAPPEDYWRAMEVSSSYWNAEDWGTQELHTSPHHWHSTEETLDQVVYIIAGLSLVPKMFDASVNWNEAFTDGFRSISGESIAIANRIWSWIDDHGGIIMNPETGFMVVGVDQDGEVGCAQNPSPSTCRGANCNGVWMGFHGTVDQMSAGYIPNRDAQWAVLHPLDWAASQVILANFDGIPESAQQFFLTLAATSDMFDYTTLGKISDLIPNTTESRATECHAEHLALLNQVLYGGTRGNGLPDSFFENMLDLALCQGESGHPNPAWEWNSAEGRRFNHYGSTNACSNADMNGIDYMYYFNLYCLANPDYLGNPTSYSYIPPEHLCPVDLIKRNYDEYDTKNFIASNSITGCKACGGSDEGPITQTCSDVHSNWGSKYIVHAAAQLNVNGSRASIPSNHSANVTFRAGHFVDLFPGFEVDYGATFDASIDGNLLPMTNCNLTYRKSTPNEESSTEENQNHSGFGLFPNPNTGKFTLTYPQLEANSEFYICDITGRIIYKRSLNISEDHADIIVNGLADGIYYWEIMTDNNIAKKGRVVLIRN